MSIIERIRRDKQLLYLSLATALRGMRDNLRYIIWQPFALSLGIPIRDIGALESLMDLAKIIIQPVLGAASDVYGRKKFLIARELTVLAAGMCFLFAESWQLLAAGMIFIGFGIALIPIWNSTVAESVEANEMGEVFSILGSAYMTTGMIGTVAAGWLADNMGYRIVYAISVGFAVLSLLVTVFKIDETHKPSGEVKFHSQGGVYVTPGHVQAAQVHVGVLHRHVSGPVRFQRWVEAHQWPAGGGVRVHTWDAWTDERGEHGGDGLVPDSAGQAR